MHGGDGGWMLDAGCWMLDAVYGESQQMAIWLPYNGMLTALSIAESCEKI